MGIELRELTPGDLPAARELLAAACAFDEAAAVAEEKVFGAAPAGAASVAFGALDRGALLGLAVASARWIRLLAVAPAARRRGIGTVLLAAAESAVEGAAARTMDQPGNYLAPGVAAANGEAIAWLERRGYRRVDEKQGRRGGGAALLRRARHGLPPGRAAGLHRRAPGAGCSSPRRPGRSPTAPGISR